MVNFSITRQFGFQCVANVGTGNRPILPQINVIRQELISK